MTEGGAVCLKSGMVPSAVGIVRPYQRSVEVYTRRWAFGICGAFEVAKRLLDIFRLLKLFFA